MKKLWMRAGVSLMLTDEEIDEILGGCEGSARQEAVVRALREGRFTFNGDSYIPRTTVEEFTKEHGLPYAAKEPKFDFDPLGGFRLADEGLVQLDQNDRYTPGMTAAQEIRWCAERIKELYPVMDAEHKAAKETFKCASILFKGNRRAKGKNEVCSFCGNPAIYAKGLCASCYNREKKYGTPDYRISERWLERETAEPKAKKPWYIRVYQEVLGSAESYPEDLEQGLLYALESLTDRERQFLLFRYRDGKTLYETGAYFSVTGECVRQIELKAIRKLRQPSRKIYLELGLAVAEKTLMENERIKAERQKQWLEATQKQYLIGQGNQELFDEEMFKCELGIEHLELSARACHCLVRSDVKSIGDLLKTIGEEMDFSRLLKIRNLGTGTMREIEDRLKKYLYLKGGKENGGSNNNEVRLSREENPKE